MRNLTILGLAAIIIGAVAVIIFFLTRGDSTTATSENMVILLDRSNAMGDPLDGATKLEVAIGVIDDILDQNLADLPNQAYRQYGGPCRGENSELVVTFGQTNEDSVRGSLHGLSTNGETTLVGGLTEIPDDFSGLAIPEGTSNHLIIITGGGDSCQADLTGALASLRAAGIAVDLIGLDIPFDQRDALERAAKAAGAGIFFANTGSELASLLSTAINRLRADAGGGGSGGASGLGGSSGAGGGSGSTGGSGGGSGTPLDPNNGGGGFGYGSQ